MFKAKKKKNKKTKSKNSISVTYKTKSNQPRLHHFVVIFLDPKIRRVNKLGALNGVNIKISIVHYLCVTRKISACASESIVSNLSKLRFTGILGENFDAICICSKVQFLRALP